MSVCRLWHQVLSIPGPLWEAVALIDPVGKNAQHNLRRHACLQQWLRRHGHRLRQLHIRIDSAEYYVIAAPVVICCHCVLCGDRELQIHVGGKLYMLKPHDCMLR